MTSIRDQQDRLFEQAVAEFGPALGRLARAYEANEDLRRDLVQDIQIALWRSFATFAQQCSLRTWIYRIAHNRAVSHVLQHKRGNLASARIEQLDLAEPARDPEAVTGEQQALALIYALIDALGPPDRQILLLYLEDTPTAEIAAITGVRPATIASKIHRFKTYLHRRHAEGAPS